MPNTKCQSNNPQTTIKSYIITFCWVILMGFKMSFQLDFIYTNYFLMKNMFEIYIKMTPYINVYVKLLCGIVKEVTIQ